MLVDAMLFSFIVYIRDISVDIDRTAKMKR